MEKGTTDYPGLSNKQAIEKIMIGLKDLLKQRQLNFTDHTQQYKKKIFTSL